MATKTQGTITVHTENIFPIIKKFLYSDHEVFLRELVSNAVDATQKLKTLSSLGEAKGELGNTQIEVIIDEKKKTLTVKDRGVGMNAAEIEKYITQIAFSGAEEFVQRYKDKGEANMIGHFGMGFYSAFMVADKVEIISKSYRDDDEAVHWVCEGSTEFSMEKHKRKERGTDIILHINAENEEFLQSYRIYELLNKYCKYLPVEIKYEDKVINQTNPIWTRKPADLTDKDYLDFYRELYPLAKDPLFWIHLNVDYPFNLTGILYFPKVNAEMELQRNKIRLFSNQVFVTEDVKDIVPEFLTLLNGVIDSPDIPLNVSRSALQADAHVKKITGHITSKVAAKLQQLFKDDRKSYEEKWSDISLFIKFGVISDPKFAEKAGEFLLYRNVKGESFTLSEYKEKVAAAQTDKNKKTVFLYANDSVKQHNFISIAENRGYDVLLMKDALDPHFIMHVEEKEEGITFARVDAGPMDKLIEKEIQRESVLSDRKIVDLKEAFRPALDNSEWKIESAAMAPEDPFVTIVRPEMDRRMREMSALGGSMGMFGILPEKFELMINTNHPLADKIANTDDNSQKQDMVRQAVDLAMLSQNMLTGERLSAFIARSEGLMMR